MSESPRPRSRFDKAEADRPLRSRFDRGERRSRSPSSREPESRRTRSPIAREGADSPATAEAKKAKAIDAAAIAAAAAARINAQIQAKKGIQHVDVPPIRAAPSPPVVRSPAANAPKNNSGEIFQQDGDYIKDIEINDLKNRYTLTKGAVQKRIKDETGADVTTRGEYYPDKAMATAATPPLYLRVTSTSKEGLEAAVKQIQDLMNQELPDLVDQRRFRRREPEQFERDEYGRRKWPEEKLPVDLEPISGFNLRAQVVGRGGDNVKYIQQETSCKVQIKGRGSGFMEQATGQESDEPMFLHIAGPKPEGVAKAKELCEELLTKVRGDYQSFKENASQGRFGGGDRFGGGRGYGDRGDRDDRGRSQSYGHGGYGGYGGHNGHSNLQSPVSGGGATNQAAQDLNAQWAAYYAQQGQHQQPGQQTEDPYAAYGGYDGYVQYYTYYYGQQALAASPAPGTAAAPPPPPGEPAPPGAAPPPPPPSGSPPASYGAVPPPPGL
ncbi:hypothetical protein BU23DRAFT_554494 [Bimuria novae-zelandiae CBS 107.79]|uniref:K Homology domain-containing protein n=1 Tax=Bimuria novae-zelandiae CBS 107.79 TaxID=1447943 RepID=A0A6A5V980_9PLEO|nr:hypothetical protein BU23DRAFT_554494 [Bimuria novae-zelandiae CBS 107.79]